MGQKESWICKNTIVTLSHFFVSQSKLTPSKSSSLKSLTKVEESWAAFTVRYLSDVPKINKVLACVDLRWICENRIQKCWVSRSLWDWNTRSWSDHLIWISNRRKVSNTVLLGSLPKYFYEILSLNDYEKYLNHLKPFPNNLIYPLPTALWSSTPGWNCLRNKTPNPHWLLRKGAQEEPVIVYCSVPGAVVPEGKLVRLQHLNTHLRFWNS